MKHYLSSLVFLVLGISVVSGQSTAAFRYLKVDRQIVTSTHAAKYKVTIDPTFKLIGQFEHQPVYNKRQFNVSIAAFSNGIDLILVHAETHTDGSGGLDYSELTPAKLNGTAFNQREQCASADDNAELDANPEIQFIRRSGYELRTPFFMNQFLATSADGKAEVVISYGRKIDDCGKLSDELKREIARQISRKIKVKKIA